MGYLIGGNGMNDTEREQWIDNDEGLYLWWKGSRQSMRAFVRENRAELDRAINRALGNEEALIGQELADIRQYDFHDEGYWFRGHRA